MVDLADDVRVPRLGLFLPGSTVGSAAPDAFERTADLAGAAEAAGFDSVWVPDGPLPADADRPGAEEEFEPYSLLGALAVRTKQVALAVLPDGAPARLPSLMAKIVAGLDVISHGRAVLSLGVGPETDGLALEQLDEELQICRALLTEDAPSFTGRHFRITDAPNRPRPVRPGGVPLVVLSAHRQVLEAVVDRADALVVSGTAAEVIDRTSTVRRRGEAAGREGSGPVILWTCDLHAPDTPGANGDDRQLASLVDAGVGGLVVRLVGDHGPDGVARAADRLTAALASP